MPFKIEESHVEYTNTLEYLFYIIFLYLQKIYLFIINLPWTNIIFWAKIIAIILIILFTIGIIYNLIGIFRAKKKKIEKEL